MADGTGKSQDGSGAGADPEAQYPGWISRGELEARLREPLKTAGRRYVKTLRVAARPAREGERVVSTTSDGIETENVAGDSDFVVENQTHAHERYLVAAEKFAKRYDRVESLGGDWATYAPNRFAQIVALRVDDAVLGLLDRDGDFFIEAPWGEAQRVRKGDVLVAPTDFREIYRIGRREFAETYTPA